MERKPYIADFMSVDEIHFASGWAGLRLLISKNLMMGMQFPTTTKGLSVCLEKRKNKLIIKSWFPLKEINFGRKNILLLDEDKIFKEFVVSDNFKIKSELIEGENGYLPFFQYIFKLTLIRNTGWIDPHYLPNSDELIFTFFKRNSIITPRYPLITKNQNFYPSKGETNHIELLNKIKDDYFQCKK